MVDKVDQATRSRMMAAIKGKNTKPEITVRKALHARGFRFRLHDEKLPGKPDIVLRKYKAVIFVHGCFWHGHECPDFRWPKTRPAWWRKKIRGNASRDELSIKNLQLAGWRVAKVWECALPKHDQNCVTQLSGLTKWIVSKRNEFVMGDKNT